jgi:hypothetical protein
MEVLAMNPHIILFFGFLVLLFGVGLLRQRQADNQFKELLGKWQKGVR